MNGPWHIDSRERVLKLGASFEKQPRCAFHTVRCECGHPGGKGGALGVGVWRHKSLRVVFPSIHLILRENRVPSAIHYRAWSPRGSMEKAGVEQVWVKP